MDATNPTGGGVSLTYSSVPPLTGDKNDCGQDPNTREWGWCTACAPVGRPAALRAVG
jgi:hypothetical protein